MHDYHHKGEGIVRPGTDCNLPPAERDENLAMQTETCSHGTLFLLVDDYLASSEWIEAQAWWDECSKMEGNLHKMYTEPERDMEYYDSDWNWEWEQRF